MGKNVILTLLLLLLFSCGKKQPGNMYTIEGETGTPNGLVCVFGTDSRHERVDSVRCDKTGAFTLSLPVDTLTPLFFVTPEGRMVPLFAEPALTATLKRDSTLKSGWSIEGGATQALHDSISRVLDATRRESRQIEKIDSFILANPISDVSIEILRRYLTDRPVPENRDIRSRTSKLGGILKDYEYIVALNKKVESKNSNVLHRSMPEFEYSINDSTEVNLETYIRKYTLVTFWASWDKNSLERLKELAAIKDSVKSESFAILNIALDYDSARWNRMLTEDSIVGDNVLDIKMFHSPLVKQFNVKSLPFTMLINPYQRVIEYDVKTEGLGARIDSLARKYDRNEEEKKKKEKEKKKKTKNN